MDTCFPDTTLIRSVVSENSSNSTLTIRLPSGADADAVMAAVVVEAAELASPGDAVVLAPAAASLDMFASYGHRRSEEHTSELQSLMRISYAVFCLKKKTYSA